MIGARLRSLRHRMEEGWEKILSSPGGPGRVARGIGAGAFAAMLPAFGLHLVLAAVLGFLLRGSMAAAGATCVLLGNPLTHALLIPTEFALGRFVLQREVHSPVHSPGFAGHLQLGHWLELGLPALEELLVGGVLIGIPVGLAAWFVARRVLLRRAAAQGAGAVSRG